MIYNILIRKWLRPNEASELCGFPVAALQRMAVKGKIEYDTTPGGHRRYPENAIQELIERVRKHISVCDECSSVDRGSYCTFGNYTRYYYSRKK